MPSTAKDGSITPLGRQLLGIPAHPRLGRLLIGSAEMGFAREGAALAALLSEKDILTRSFGRDARPEVHADSDVLIRLDRLEEAEHARFAHLFATGGSIPPPPDRWPGSATTS